MNLIIDQGNTLTKVAIFEGNSLTEDFMYEEFGLAECKLLLSLYSIKYCVLCSVINTSKEVLVYLDNNLSNFLFIDENTRLPIINEYKSPKTLGKDRLAAVVGANQLFPKSNLLIIDIGTAITYEFVDSNSIYHGGNISPGLSLRFKALNSYTDKLPLTNRHGDIPLIGFDTDTAIRSGVVNGIVCEIRGYIDELTAKYPNLEIILTGGHASFIAPFVERSANVDKKLVLKGLNRILNYNVEQ